VAPLRPVFLDIFYLSRDRFRAFPSPRRRPFPLLLERKDTSYFFLFFLRNDPFPEYTPQLRIGFTRPPICRDTFGRLTSDLAFKEVIFFPRHGLCYVPVSLISISLMIFLSFLFRSAIAWVSPRSHSPSLHRKTATAFPGCIFFFSLRFSAFLRSSPLFPTFFPLDDVYSPPSTVCYGDRGILHLPPDGSRDSVSCQEGVIFSFSLCG